jgi:hypothetical protein
MNMEQLRRDAEAAFSLGATEDETWAFVGNALNSKSYGGLDSAVKNMIIQQAMQKKAEISNFITNILKTLHEASMAIIRNMRLG